MLTDLQSKFCLMVALYGLDLADAAREAGYVGKSRAEFYAIGKRLADKLPIAQRIIELKETCFNPEDVRRSIILELMQTRQFCVTDILQPYSTVDENGNPFIYVKMKPFEQWSLAAKKMCIGFDKKTNLPLFRNGADATKELCRIFGFYKDNMETREEDTASVLAAAGLVPSYQEPQTQQMGIQDDFDGSKFDMEVCPRIVDKEFDEREVDEPEDEFWQDLSASYYGEGDEDL